MAAETGVGKITLPVPMHAGQPAGCPERPEPTPPTVLVLSVMPGMISTASLLVHRPEPVAGGTEGDGLAELAGVDAAERHPFDPPQGTLAARLLASLPGWLQAVIATAKYWVPVLVAVGVAAHEVERRKRKPSAVSGRSIGAPEPDPTDPGTSEPAERSPHDAHR